MGNNPMGAISGNLFNANANSGQKMTGGRRRKVTRKVRKGSRKSRNTRRR